MNERESNLPLLVAFAMSVAVHLLGMPALVEGLTEGGSHKPLAVTEPVSEPEDDESESEKEEIPPDKPEPSEKLVLGENDAPPRKTVAWISRDEYEELYAPRAEVIQPAVQMKTDPVPEAPLRIDASAPPSLARINTAEGQRALLVQPTPKFSITPPATEVAPPDQSAKQVESEGPDQPEGKPDDLVESVTEALKRADAVPSAQDDTALPDIGDLLETPSGLAMKDLASIIDPIIRERSESESSENKPPLNQPKAESENPDLESEKSPRKQEKIEAEERDDDPKPMRERVAEEEKTPSTAGARSKDGAEGEDDEKPRRTSAPKDKKESAAFVIEEPINVFQAGKVEVTDGLEIKTVSPRVSTIIYQASKPTRGEFLITFDREGWVRKVDIIQSMRYEEIDKAVERAMYKWTAEGKQLEEINGDIQILIAVRPWR